MTNNFGSGGIHFTFSGTPQFKTELERVKYDLDVALKRLNEVNEKPQIFAAVLAREGDRATVCTGPQTLSLKCPTAMDGIEPGAVVRILGGDPPSIRSVCDSPQQVGTICNIKQVIDEEHIEVVNQGQTRVVLIKKNIERKAGDKVVLDLTGSCVTGNLGSGDKSRAFTEVTNVDWDDIGGQQEAKQTLIEAIEEPVLHKDLYSRYIYRHTRGVLLYGPAGTGKTMLGKAAATALARVHGAKDGAFIYVKGPELLNMFAGNTEAAIRSLFSSAREHKEAHGYPAIIFIDECDSLLGKRGVARFEGLERTIVPQFLAEMDGLNEVASMVILATNRPDMIDPAIVRKGRVDVKCFIRRPNRDEAEGIFKMYLKRLPFANGHTLDSVAKVATEEIFNDLHGIYMVRTKDGKDRRFSLGSTVSGALIEGLALEAAMGALRRERDQKGDKKNHGLMAEDVIQAIKSEIKQLRDLDHTEALSTFIAENKLDVTKVDRL